MTCFLYAARAVAHMRTNMKFFLFCLLGKPAFHRVQWCWPWFTLRDYDTETLNTCSRSPPQTSFWYPWYVFVSLSLCCHAISCFICGPASGVLKAQPPPNNIIHLFNTNVSSLQTTLFVFQALFVRNQISVKCETETVKWWRCPVLHLCSLLWNGKQT